MCLTAFSEGMVEDGYEDVVSIDISSVVIEAMQNKYANRAQLKCILIWLRESVEYFEINFFWNKFAL